MTSPLKVNFLDRDNCTLYDSQGKPVLCKCGNPSSGAFIGIDYSTSWCDSCSPISKKTAIFVYKPPNEDRLPPLAIDSWVVNLKEHKDDKPV